MAELPGNNTFVLLFGNVDLDFIYYRHCCLKGVVEDVVHLQRCISAYKAFLEDLLLKGQERGRSCKICVLAPQASPIRDEVFVEVTSRQAKVGREAIRKLGDRIDVSHSARLARTRMFADMLERDIALRDLIRVFRIDGEMIGPDGALVDRFYPKLLMEHHANPLETHKSWRRALSDELDIFHRFRPAATPDMPLAPAAA
ncbi:hypothetical protein GXW78_24270 [Roseomonas terrae]|uniref:Uncharacterized protein n=1 Tax=Neoroseomonas terrae TaxID=424799 RepID=A0ABS5EP37_9PROT|nr:hypothetical protein [Neoroseomonas terrae]